MDIFDERIFSILKDGKPRLLSQLLGEVGFSHNTLKLHLERLLSEGLLVREKNPLMGLEGPALRTQFRPSLQAGFRCPIRPFNGAGALAF